MTTTRAGLLPGAALPRLDAMRVLLAASSDTVCWHSRSHEVPNVREVIEMTLSSGEVRAIIGPVDEVLLADILATGASAKELAEAWAWVNAEEALADEGRPLPTGRIARLVDLLDPGQENEL
ncbi:hypothetical protein [Rhizobium sp. CC1099]